jgi:tetratricopeptide (TPR) repeat protein
MRPGGRFLTALGGGALLIAASWGTWIAIRPIPVLDRNRLQVLTSAGRFQDAEEVLAEHLRAVPSDAEARFLLAQLLLERPDGLDRPGETTAREALDHLARIRPESNERRALIRLYEGKAMYRLLRWGECETAMNDALRLDPAVPEAGWILLDLYYLEGRHREASRLVMQLFEVEPDPRDRAQYLLELLRQDVQPLDAASVVEQLTPVVQAEPDAVAPAVALGLAQIHNSHTEPGLEILKQTYDAHRDDPAAWDGLMEGHETAGQPEGTAALLDILPSAFLVDPRFERHRGRVAEWQGNWKAAIDHYEKAIDYDPHDPVLVYRLGLAQRRNGNSAEAERLAANHEDYHSALREALPLYEEANALPDLGVRPYPDVCHRLAVLRGRMLRHEEARAWSELAEGAARAAVPVDRPTRGG